jgi:hypothetical protein
VVAIGWSFRVGSWSTTAAMGAWRSAGAFGFDDLRGYLQARCDAGYSVARIATELGVCDWQV